MATQVDCLVREPALLGEGPLWSPGEQALYWVDIKGRRLHRLQADGTRQVWSTPALLSCVVTAKGGGLVGALGRAVCRLELGPPGGELTGSQIARLPDLPDHVRFNDGKVAPDGALWVGTMDDEELRSDGAWWRFGPDGSVAQLDTGYGVTNGPEFDEVSGLGYVTDSARRTIFVIDGWGAEACDRKRPLREFDEAEGYPDGMTLDSEGRLWVAFWDGGCVRALDPITGTTLVQVDLPAARPTSCAFGGPDRGVLYVTSASIGLDAGVRPEGGLFGIRLGSVTGRAGASFG